MGPSSSIRCTAKRVTAMAFVVWAALLARPALAARSSDEPLSAGALGRIVDLPSGRGEAELLQLDERLAPALLATRPEESLRVEGWPVAPGVRRAVVLSRREIYAPDAKIFRVDGKTLIEVPRSTFAFFLGEDTEGAGTRLMVSVDPATGTLTALIHGPEGVHEISRDASGKGGRHLLARPVQPPGGGAWTCGQEDSIETSLDYRPSRGESALAERAPAVLTSLHSAVVAIDTDNEYMAYWSNNTTSATNYIAQLLASINVMYERDLKLRLLQGTTFLRTTADPYSAYDGGNAGPNELNEFTNYWNLNLPKASFPRSAAAMLSGKQSSPNSASGIAWLAGSVCGSSNDYSFSQLFKTSYLAGDTMILGHEIGHNLGSPHTHCYADPAPDRCYAGESCYTGATSCPGAQTINGVANVTGTLMGYCHLSGIAGCSTSLVFHPSTISRYVGPTLDAGVSSGCLAVVGAPPPPPPVSTATTFHPLAPCRLIDTRNPAGPFGGPALPGSGSRTFTVTGACVVPASAKAVSSNVTVVNPLGQGDLVAYPAGIAGPLASTVSFRAGKTRANNAQIMLSQDGTGRIVVQNNSAGALDLVVDVNGYYQ
jgi:Metallo-peptidase family M12